MSKSAHENLRTVIEELASVRDSVRLRSHLLNLETKERWQEIESKLQAAEDELSRDAQQSMVRVRELVRSARSFVEQNLKSH